MMKTVLFALALLSCECRIATAGDLAFSDSRNAVEPHPLPPDEDGWQLTLTPYGWLANLDGTLGVRGYTTPVDIKFDDILNNLDMVALINMEARKGRWGDGLTLPTSMCLSAATPRGLSSIPSESALSRCWRRRPCSIVCSTETAASWTFMRVPAIIIWEVPSS